MDKKALNVLIVDDDSSQGTALLEAVKRVGYNAEWTASPQQAMTLVHHIDFHAILVDCMLPKINGVDLVHQLKPHLAEGAEVFLMTGVFKDRTFIKEASEKTHCTHFFVKPFNLESWLTYLHKALAKWQGPEEDPFLKLYQGPLSEPQKWFEQHTTLHALHLPMLLKRIQQAKLTGQLILSHGSSIGFYQGDVYEVKNADNQSFFGIIAIEKGYASGEDVESVLQNQDHRPIGQSLIESLSLSPHALSIILEEQIALRLSQSVQDINAEIHWLKKDIQKPSLVLHPERLNTLFKEWLPSKYEDDWLRTLFTRWGSCSLQWVNSKDVSLPNNTDAVHEKDAVLSPHEMFQALLLDRVHIGGKSAPVINYKSMQQKLERALQSFRSSNLFQILGLSEKARATEINRAYELLRRAFVIPQDDPSCPVVVKEMAEKIATLLKNAHSTLSDEASRNAYVRDLEFKKSQEIMDLEPTFRAAVVELHTGHFLEAIDKFDLLISKRAIYKDLKAYRLWAQIKAGVVAGTETELFEQIAPEERYSATYMMAKGAFYFTRMQYAKAMECFKNAGMLDPKLKAAGVEHDLAEEALHASQETRIVREVKGAFGSLFGKSKSKKPKKSA